MGLNNMKKTYIGFLLLGFVLLLGLYMFGDSLYALNKPIITTVSPARMMGGENIFLPPEAIHRNLNGDYVFLLNSVQGFSRTVFTVTRVDVDVLDEDDGQGRVVLAHNQEILSNGRVVITDTHLDDGMRVIFGR